MVRGAVLYAVWHAALPKRKGLLPGATSLHAGIPGLALYQPHPRPHTPARAASRYGVTITAPIRRPAVTRRPRFARPVPAYPLRACPRNPPLQCNHRHMPSGSCAPSNQPAPSPPPTRPARAASCYGVTIAAPIRRPAVTRRPRFARPVPTLATEASPVPTNIPAQLLLQCNHRHAIRCQRPRLQAIPLPCPGAYGRRARHNIPCHTHAPRRSCAKNAQKTHRFFYVGASYSLAPVL